MKLEEITPHLNKIVKLNLKNNRRKIGWLYIDFYHRISQEPINEVHCVNVRQGKKFILRDEEIDFESVLRYSEVIPIDDIFNIRSSI